MRGTLTAILVTTLLIAGCGGEAGEETTVPAMTAPATPTTTVAASTTTATAPKVEVVGDLVYHPETERLGKALLDVYALPGVEGGPVVVLFHGHGCHRITSPYPALASALAEQGAVVFVPDWEKGQPVTDTSRDDLLAVVDGAACAVSYALAHAAEYGADPERLILFGHSAGATRRRW